jgi:hypothetical protein
MWRQVGLVQTEVSEKRIASVFREEKSSETSVLQDSHGVISQKTTFFNSLSVLVIVFRMTVFIVTAVKISNPTSDERIFYDNGVHISTHSFP